MNQAGPKITRLEVTEFEYEIQDMCTDYNVPIWQLLGGHISSLPAYASTSHGDENGGLGVIDKKGCVYGSGSAKYE